MKATLVALVVVGALFAAIATVIHASFLAGNVIALLVLVWLAASATGLVAVRFHGRTASAAPDVPAGRSRADTERRRSFSPAIPPDAQRETGTVKWFNRSKGFGFIIRDNGGEIFVHYRSIRAAGDDRRPGLRDGQNVSFVAVESPKGWQAEDVTGD